MKILEGAEFIKEAYGEFHYKHACATCGYVDENQPRHIDIGGHGIQNTSFWCNNCGEYQQVRIQMHD